MNSNVILEMYFIHACRLVISSYQQSFEFQAAGIPVGDDISHLTCGTSIQKKTLCNTYIYNYALKREMRIKKKLTDDSSENEDAYQVTGNRENIPIRHRRTEHKQKITSHVLFLFLKF